MQAKFVSGFVVPLAGSRDLRAISLVVGMWPTDCDRVPYPLERNTFKAIGLFP